MGELKTKRTEEWKFFPLFTPFNLFKWTFTWFHFYPSFLHELIGETFLNISIWILKIWWDSGNFSFSLLLVSEPTAWFRIQKFSNQENIFTVILLLPVLLSFADVGPSHYCFLTTSSECRQIVNGKKVRVNIINR